MINAELRRLGLGGTDIGPIYGVGRYRTAGDVWVSKKGGLPPSPPDEVMLTGTFLQAAILAMYAWVTKREVELCDQTFMHPTRKWMVYSPDGFVKGEQCGVDAKYVHWTQAKEWGSTPDDIPLDIQFQAAWYNAAYGWPRW